MRRDTADIAGRLRSLSAVKCRMRHERVARDPDTCAPLRNPANPGAFKRVDLCPSSVRRGRMACGHTDARRWFRDGLTARAGRFGADDPQVRALDSEFRRLDAELGQIDHAKGVAEAVLAEALAAQSDPGSIAAARSETDRIADCHEVFVDALASLRDRLVSLLDR